MKVIAMLEADLEWGALGTESRLAVPLNGRPVLRHTVEQLRRSKHLRAVFVLCPPAQFRRCQQILEGTGALVRAIEAGPRPWGRLVQSARKWSLDSWRGGIGGTTYFDEFVDARVLAAVLSMDAADAVFSAPASAPLLDSVLADEMIEHHEKHRDDSRLTFVQAPPGVAGIVLEASLVHELADKAIPVGWLFGYKPENPQKDLTFQTSCIEVSAELRYAAGRLTADTRRSFERVSALINDCPNADATTIGHWLMHREETTVEPLPREVEIELTTDDPYPHTLLRPRGDRVPPRGPIALSVVERAVAEAAQYDDALIVLGGFGDPLRHPRLADVLQAIRAAGDSGCGPFGLAVRTTGVDLSDPVIEALVTSQVDVLNVLLDAWTPDLYGRLHSPSTPHDASLQAVEAKLERLSELRPRRQSAIPLLVPELTKACDNLHELEDFHDGWLRRVGAVTISGYSHHARQRVDRAVLNMAPAPRSACRRLRSRCLILSDGRMTMCDQDFGGQQTVGRIGEQTLGELWNGTALQRIREAHQQSRFEVNPLCAACDEWHRP